jgi:hypothetical protein
VWPLPLHFKKTSWGHWLHEDIYQDSVEPLLCTSRSALLACFLFRVFHARFSDDLCKPVKDTCL